MRLVLLPGLDGTGILFQPLLEQLPSSVAPTVIALPNDAPMGYDELVAYVCPLLPRHEPYVLLGESFSGPLSLLLAAQQPLGLRGVILCASFVSNPTPLPSLLRHLAGSWLFRLTPAFVQAKALLEGYSSPRLRQLLAQAHSQVAPSVMAQRVRSVLTVHVGSALSLCPVPVAYLRGEHDHVVPARNLTQITSLNPRVSVFTVSAPHLVLQVQPEASATAIQSFIDSIERTESSEENRGA